MQQIANMIQTETHICKLILNYFSINAPISNYLSFLAIISWFKLQRGMTVLFVIHNQH